MLTLLAIVYTIGSLVILLVTNFKGQRINFGHFILFILLPGMVFSSICYALDLYNISESYKVAKIPDKSSTSYIVRYDINKDKYFVLAEDLFDISKAKYRVYLDNDTVEVYIDHVNDFTKYIEGCVLDDN